MLDNLPPGVTPAMIDDLFRDAEPDYICENGDLLYEDELIECLKCKERVCPVCREEVKDYEFDPHERGSEYDTTAERDGDR